MQLNAAIVDRPPNDDENRVLHQTIGAVTDDIAKLSFNTAISRMMEFTNHFTAASERPRAAMEKFVLLLSPFAPHMAEELWQALGHKESLAYEPWPEFDPVARQGRLDRSARSNQRQGPCEDHVCPTAAERRPRSQPPIADPHIAELLAGKANREKRSSPKAGS